MGKSYVFEGKTTNEAIENGLKELKVSKNKVDIKVLDSEEKRSFFSILTPRVVKVELTLKDDVKEENIEKTEKQHKKEIKEIEYDKDLVKKNIENFLDEFMKNLSQKDMTYKIEFDKEDVYVEIEGENTGYLIGYRGEVLNNLQTILTNIASKGQNYKIKVLLNIGGYREKRKKDKIRQGIMIFASPKKVIVFIKLVR